jgi:hypothetical protein
MKRFNLLTKGKKYLFLVLIFGLFFLGIGVVSNDKVFAWTGKDFNAGRIIDDGVFTNSGSMSVNDIQNFLNAQVPNCDTNGSQLSNHSNGSGGYYTHAQWGAIYDQNNNTNTGAAPYVCLKNYWENPSTGQNNLQNPNLNVSNGQSAAQIIDGAAKKYNINPRRWVFVFTYSTDNTLRLYLFIVFDIKEFTIFFVYLFTFHNKVT